MPIRVLLFLFCVTNAPVLWAQDPSFELGYVHIVKAGNGVRREPCFPGTRRAIAARAEQRFGERFGLSAGFRKSVGMRSHTCPDPSPPQLPDSLQNYRYTYTARPSIESAGYTAVELQGRLHRSWSWGTAVVGGGGGYGVLGERTNREGKLRGSPFLVGATGVRLVVSDNATIGLEGELLQWRLWGDSWHVDVVRGVQSTTNLGSSAIWARAAALGIWLRLQP